MRCGRVPPLIMQSCYLQKASSRSTLADNGYGYVGRLRVLLETGRDKILTDDLCRHLAK